MPLSKSEFKRITEQSKNKKKPDDKDKIKQQAMADRASRKA